MKEPVSEASNVSTPLVALRDVWVEYGSGANRVTALRGVTLTVTRGECVAILGPSGSGKTTLLNVTAGLERPTRGSVEVSGVDLAMLADSDLARMRRRTLAYVFQFFALLPTLTAADNVALPLRADRLAIDEVRRRTQHALEAVGLESRADRFPSQLSGGEQQRVAIARALAADAPLILADEPTGNLDSVRGEAVLELLRTAVERHGKSVLLVTHDLRACAYGDRILTLEDGVIVDETRGATIRTTPLPLRR